MNRDDIRYYIDEEKKTIVAVVEDCMFNAVETIAKAHNGSVVPNVDLLIMPDSFRGVAKCNPEDTWNEEIGMQVARKKLYSTYNKMKYQSIKKYLNKLDEYRGTCINIRDHLSNLIFDIDPNYHG